MGPSGGVGVAFEDRLDSRTGTMLKIVAEVFAEGAAAEWNASCGEDEKIHAGDLLVEVNGERVAGLNMQTLSTLVPGPVDTPVILRLRSVKGNNEFEAELIRQIPQTSLGWRPPNPANAQGTGSAPPALPGSPAPRESIPPPQEPTSPDEEYYLQHDAKITTMKSYGERLACPGFSIEAVPEDKNAQTGMGFMIGNVTKGSQAYEYGFRHGEVI